MNTVVGIDLGTTNSLVAYVKDGVPVVIRDRGGDALLPSVVSVAEDQTVYVGREAERRLLTDSGRTVYSVKRFMGKGVHDVGEEARLFPFRLAGDPGGMPASSPCTTSAAARSTSLFSASKTASSRCCRPTATRISAATTSICCW